MCLRLLFPFELSIIHCNNTANFHALLNSIETIEETRSLSRKLHSNYYSSLNILYIFASQVHIHKCRKTVIHWCNPLSPEYLECIKTFRYIKSCSRILRNMNNWAPHLVRVKHQIFSRYLILMHTSRFLKINLIHLVSCILVYESFGINIL